jgi:hypothetical protein
VACRSRTLSDEQDVSGYNDALKNISHTVTVGSANAERTFIKDKQSQFAHPNKAMSQSIKKHLMCRHNDPDVMKYGVPNTLLGPKLDIVPSTQELESVTR